MPGGPPMGGVGKAEMDFGGPVLDCVWKEDGMHVFGAGCSKTVKLWNLQTNQTQDVATVRACAARGGGGGGCGGA